MVRSHLPDPSPPNPLALPPLLGARAGVWGSAPQTLQGDPVTSCAGGSYDSRERPSRRREEFCVVAAGGSCSGCNGAGRHPLPQVVAGLLVGAVHDAGALREPSAGVQPQPGVQQAGGVAGEVDAVGGDPQWVVAAQWWVVAAQWWLSRAIAMPRLIVTGSGGLTLR